MAKKLNKAIIIGGSITGLLAARALVAHCKDVIIIERDRFPDEVKSRGGVPQDRQGHLLMARGQEMMESIVPEIRQDFIKAGLSEIRWGLDTRILMSGGWMKVADTGIRSYAVSRLWLEQRLRHHVLRHPRIHLIDRAQVTNLITDSTNKIVYGVNYETRGKRDVSAQMADLVIDTSGRSSKTAQWLGDLGIEDVPVTTINPYMGYATRWYEKPTDIDIDWKLYISYAQPENGLYRSGAIVEVEDNKWMAMLGGTNKDYAPTDEAAYDNFLQSLAAPEIYDYLQHATPISPIYGYRNTANEWKHYEQLSTLPDGLLVMGDALCKFNPIYAQGMSVAVKEVLTLKDALVKSHGYLDEGFNMRVQKHLAKIVKDSWNLSATADALLPEATGDKPHPAVVIGQHYITKLTEIMPHDKEVAALFLSIMHMLKSPTALFHPRILWKLMRYQINKPESDNKWLPKFNDDTISSRTS